MSTIQFKLTPELEAFVQSQISAGRFQSVEETMTASLRLLEERTKYSAHQLNQLREELAAAERGAIAGPEVFDELDLYIDELYEKRK